MNERILELAQQAGITTNLETDFFEKDPNEWVDYFSQKFAELIIRECMEQVRDEVQYEYDWKLADAVTKRVMEHFGVEE